MTYDLSELQYYTIGNDKIKARITNYGCTLLNLWVRNSKGEFVDVVLGYEDIEDYFDNPPCFGSCVLPNANRIEGASFSLNGNVYSLDKNDGENDLHSGFEPLHKRLWNVESQYDNSVSFSIDIQDMDCGMPGNRCFAITYTIDSYRLSISYNGFSDADTLFNPTNHSYFNLCGHDHGDILSHELTINANSFTASDSSSICHGKIRDVADTPMDFTTPTPIGLRIDEEYDQLVWGKGYDHNYALNEDAIGGSIPATTLSCPDSDITLNIYTDMPGIQVYTGNYLSSDDIGKGNHPYSPRSGVALETQFYPNAINVDGFVKPILNKDTRATYCTSYEFVVS